MAVVGLDIGDHSTYISLARQGGVDTIANDYTQRATPTIVALGGRQRFMGVSAENQRNLTVKNTVSYFKNFLGRKYKDEYVQRMIGRVGAEVVELQNEQVGFRVQGNDYQPEQLLAMMFTTSGFTFHNKPTISDERITTVVPFLDFIFSHQPSTILRQMASKKQIFFRLPEVNVHGYHIIYKDGCLGYFL